MTPMEVTPALSTPLAPFSSGGSVSLFEFDLLVGNVMPLGNPTSDVKGRTIGRALESQEGIELPFRCGVIRGLRKPYALVFKSQRKRAAT